MQGTVVARYENRLTLVRLTLLALPADVAQRALVNPASFARKGLKIPGKADPVGRSDLVYYSDINHRGYLALDAAARRAKEAVEEVAPAPVEV